MLAPLGLDELRSVRGRLIWGSDHYDVVVDALRRAKVSVWIATANLKDVHVRTRGGRYRSILGELDHLAREGVELRILHATLPSRSFRDAFDEHPRLVEGGLQLRLCPRVHCKTVIVDGRWLYLGSANFIGAGLGVKAPHRRNFELGWWTDDEQVIDAIQCWYEQVWIGGHCAGCGQRNVCEAPLDVGTEVDVRAKGRTLVRWPGR